MPADTDKDFAWETNHVLYDHRYVQPCTTSAAHASVNVRMAVCEIQGPSAELLTCKILGLFSCKLQVALLVYPCTLLDATAEELVKALGLGMHAMQPVRP